MMTFQDIWHRLLPRYDEREARAVARLLLEDGFGLSLTDIYSDGLERLTVDERKRLEEAVGRLQEGEPVQFVVGRAAFRGRCFHVEKGVLIPRVETSELVDHILNKVEKPSPRILDLGTGSGCIAISLKLELKEARVEAIDISDEALRVARRNADELGAEVAFRRGDMLSGEVGVEAGYDAVVSNPPYIERDEAREMESRVLDYEPETALFTSDADPLVFCRAIASVGQHCLKPGGLLAMEINPRHAKALPELLKGYGYNNIAIEKDCFGKERFVTARLNKNIDFIR